MMVYQERENERRKKTNDVHLSLSRFWKGSFEEIFSFYFLHCCFFPFFRFPLLPFPLLLLPYRQFWKFKNRKKTYSYSYIYQSYFIYNLFLCFAFCFNSCSLELIYHIAQRSGIMTLKVNVPLIMVQRIFFTFSRVPMRANSLGILHPFCISYFFKVTCRRGKPNRGEPRVRWRRSEMSRRRTRANWRRRDYSRANRGVNRRLEGEGEPRVHQGGLRWSKVNRGRSNGEAR